MLLPDDIMSMEASLSSELKLSPHESLVFLLIIKSGRMTPKRISYTLEITIHEAMDATDSLVKKGMLIEIVPGEYESLHPRFATSNRYRILCAEENIELKKNIRIDNLGLALESHYENARTK